MSGMARRVLPAEKVYRKMFGNQSTIRTLAAAAVCLVVLSSCGRKKYDNVISKDTQQPDKVLFDKAIADIERSRYEVARLTLQTLINTYDTSEFLAKAKLAIADSWMREGGSHALAQAEAEYKDFILFYPTMEEAAEAQDKICTIHYKQMEKPDRDQQKTREALEKFDDMLRAYPNSPLKDEALARRAEVQDRLARHEHIVARFYIKRGSWNSAVQRLNYLVDTYPNYSQRDVVFYDLGHALTKLGRSGEARLYFERVVSEFPKSDYADQARRRLNDSKA